MSWPDRIVVDPEVLAGQPVIRGTRLAVEVILELLAAGQSEADILANYPGLTREDVLACLAYDQNAPRKAVIGHVDGVADCTCHQIATQISTSPKRIGPRSRLSDPLRIQPSFDLPSSSGRVIFRPASCPAALSCYAA